MLKTKRAPIIKPTDIEQATKSYNLKMQLLNTVTELENTNENIDFSNLNKAEKEA